MSFYLKFSTFRFLNKNDKNTLQYLGVRVNRNFLVELDNVQNVVPATKEHRAPFMNVGGNDVEDAFCPRRGDSPSLEVIKSNRSHRKQIDTPVPSRRPWERLHTTVSIFRSYSSYRLDTRKFLHKGGFCERQQP